MSQFEASEVMMEYAKLMAPSNDIKKEAIAPLIAGALWLINYLGLAYTAYEVGAMVYRYFFAAYNTVKSLITNLEALDPGELVKDKVDKWIETLSAYLDFFKEPPTTTDQQVAMANMKARVNGLGELLKYLKQMQQEWPTVKENLTDWGRDPAQAEKSLLATTTTVEELLNKLTADLKAAHAKAIQEKGQATGVDFMNVAKDIIALETRIQQSGEKPIYERTDIDERNARNLANRIINETATEEEMNQYGNAMAVLRDRMQNSLQRMQARQSRKQRSKPANLKPYISKRAFRTSDEPVPATQRQPGAPRVVKNQTVQLLQRLINRLNVALNSGIDRIDEDGVYGVDTAAAFTGLVSKFPRLKIFLRQRAGLDEKYIVDFKVMSDPDYLNDAVRVLYNYLQEVTGGQAIPGGAQQEQTQDPTQGVQCNPNKADPSPEEISACLRSIMMVDPKSGREVSLYMFLQGKGLSEQGMREYIYRKYRARAPKYWSWSEIADDFKAGRYSL